MGKQDSGPAKWPWLSAFDSRMSPNPEAALQRRREAEAQRQRAADAHAREMALPNPYSRKPFSELAKALEALRGERTYGTVGGPPPFANAAGRVLAGAVAQGFLSDDLTFSAAVVPALQFSYGEFYVKACDFFRSHAAAWGQPEPDMKTADVRRRVEDGTLMLVHLLEAASERAKAGAPADAAALSGGGKKTGKEASGQKETRVWTADFCPMPGCGRPVEYITMTDFEKRTGTKGETVKARILKGAYCHDGTCKVPWCSTHKERTPFGQGAEKPVEPAPKFKPAPEDVRVMWLQCADLLHDRMGLPKPDMDEVNLDVEPIAGSPRELVQAGVTAAIEKAAQLGRILTKDEIEEIAGPVMKKEDRKEYRSRNHPELRDSRIDFHSAAQRAGAADRDRPKNPPSRKKSST